MVQCVVVVTCIFAFTAFMLSVLTFVPTIRWLPETTFGEIIAYRVSNGACHEFGESHISEKRTYRWSMNLTTISLVFELYDHIAGL